MRFALSASAALLLSLGSSSAQTTGPAQAMLKTDQCSNAWEKMVMQSDVGKAAAPHSGGNFAQVDDVAQVDINLDGTIDKLEFATACAKGLVYAAPSVAE
jgi:hypothetical protein